jgi:hypothetical protein
LTAPPVPSSLRSRPPAVPFPTPSR